MDQLVDVHFRNLVVQAPCDVHHFAHIDVFKFMQFGQYVCKLVLHDLVLTEFENPQAEAIEIAESALPIVGEKIVPQPHRIVKAELLAEH